ncbi:MAG TPA: hypothetical protein VK506_02930 [Conexibacter sp.]|nr:hypothetical protein [Conexibacter sp.]
MTRDRAHSNAGQDARRDVEAIERVEVAADYCAELSVPFTAEQLVALEHVAREQRISPAEAAQRLVERALAARARS